MRSPVVMCGCESLAKKKKKRLGAEELMFLNYGAGEDF